MTRIVGNVKDVGMNGVEGLLYAYSGFRPEGQGVIAPRRSYWVVSDGELPDDVNVYPGPAVLLIEAGMDARREFKVTIPDQDTVTLGELVVGGFDWDEEVVSIVDSYLVEMRELADQVKVDRDRSEAARVGAETAQDRAEAARDAAEGYRDQAGTSASAAADSETNAATSEANSKASEIAAGEGREEAESARDQAKGYATTAQGHANDASSSSASARGYRDDAESSATSAGKDRDHVDSVKTLLETLLEDTEAWSDVKSALENARSQWAADIKSALDDLRAGVNPALDTLQELATALGNDPNFSATVIAALGDKATKKELAAVQGAVDAVSWDSLPGKPSSFPPATHGHEWDEIRSKPGSYPPSSHKHTVSQVDGLKQELEGKATPAQVNTKIAAALDAKIQLVAEYPDNPVDGVLYLKAES